MKKKWILIGLSAGLLAAVITGGVALAWGGPGHGRGYDGHGWVDGRHEGRLSALSGKVASILDANEQETADALTQAWQELRDEAQENALNDIAGRVAETLGDDADDTAGAIKQVADEMRSEALETKLQAAIENGDITEEQTQNIRDNMQSAGWRSMGFGFKKDSDLQEFANRVGAILGAEGDDVADAIRQAINGIRSEALEVKLQEAIDSGKITAEEAAEIRDKTESGHWHGFGKRGRHGRHGGKGHWGRSHHRGISLGT